MRDQGAIGVKLAARVSILSKSRNTLAHPDVSMLEDIHSLAVRVADDLEDRSRDGQAQDAATHMALGVCGHVSLEGRCTDGFPIRTQAE